MQENFEIYSLVCQPCFKVNCWEIWIKAYCVQYFLNKLLLHLLHEERAPDRLLCNLTSLPVLKSLAEDDFNSIFLLSAQLFKTNVPLNILECVYSVFFLAFNDCKNLVFLSRCTLCWALPVPTDLSPCFSLHILHLKLCICLKNTSLSHISYLNETVLSRRKPVFFPSDLLTATFRIVLTAFFLQHFWHSLVFFVKQKVLLDVC